MTYAQVSTGFKGGGVNPRPFFAVQARLLSLLPSPPLTPAALELFASDNVTTTDAIEQQFGFRPRGLAEHVRREGLYA